MWNCTNDTSSEDYYFTTLSHHYDYKPKQWATEH